MIDGQGAMLVLSVIGVIWVIGLWNRFWFLLSLQRS